jgi:hypothetical protein
MPQAHSGTSETLTPLGNRVRAPMSYVGAMSVRPRFFANDQSRNVLALDPRTVWIEDARRRAAPARLEEDGFTIVAHSSAVSDFRDSTEVARLHPSEIESLVQHLTGAAAVVVSSPGVLRFGERSADCGRLNNSRPARFIHIDVSAATGNAFAERARPAELGGVVRRFAHYNVWRVLSPPPQDVPLALCSAPSLDPDDVVAADAVFDRAGQPEWSFEALLVRYNPRHRWSYYSGMSREEALVFKTYDSDPTQPCHVPHCAFDDPTCPAGVTPRASIEMRAIAYWT